MGDDRKKAAPAKEKKVDRSGKRVRKGRKHESLKTAAYYDVKGSAVSRKNKTCPRCGPGTWLGEHKDRLYCGRCAYTEFKSKAPEKA